MPDDCRASPDDRLPTGELRLWQPLAVAALAMAVWLAVSHPREVYRPTLQTTLIGPGRTRMILMGGTRVTADEALAWGLVDRLSTPESLIEDARALTTDACAAPAGHPGRIKALIPGIWSH